MGIAEETALRESALPFRLLVIEDDSDREQRLRSWMPPDVRVVVARSGGAAMGILQRDRGSVYAGIILDHDLYLSPATETDRFLSGLEVANSIIECCDRTAHILVHSMNATRRILMVQELTEAGFEVTQIPMEQLTREAFLKWLEDLRNEWSEASD